MREGVLEPGCSGGGGVREGVLDSGCSGGGGDFD